MDNGQKPLETINRSHWRRRATGATGDDKPQEPLETTMIDRSHRRLSHWRRPTSHWSHWLERRRTTPGATGDDEPQEPLEMTSHRSHWRRRRLTGGATGDHDNDRQEPQELLETTRRSTGATGDDRQEPLLDTRAINRSH